MLQYYPELEVVELVQDGPRFFWDHLIPTAHVNSFLYYLAVSYKLVAHSLYIRDIHLELKVRAP
jgi:hypothetical protein